MKSRRKPTPVVGLPDSLASLIKINERLQAEVDSHFPQGRAGESPWVRAMIDQVPDYLFVKDTKCRFVVANKAVAADLGHGDPTALLGKTDLELHPPELARQFYENDRRVMETGVASLDQEEFVVLQSGEKRWLSTSKLPLRSPDGAIVGLVGIARDITARKKAEEQVKFLAFHDPLTGLPNRAQFAHELMQLVMSPHRVPGAALLYIDLDQFKAVNDTLGHVAGDTLLKHVAARILKTVPAAATIARLGGDEFAVLLTGKDGKNSAQALSQQILSALRAPFELAGDTVTIGASIGIAPLRNKIDAEQVLKEADIALYEAKALGRNRSQVFKRSFAEAAQTRLAVERDLRVALQSGDQFALALQPIYSADARIVVGAEALIRWNHPSLGVLAPDIFIGIAETRGLIEGVGEWVLANVCQFLLTSQVPWIAINVSPVELRAAAYPGRTLETIRQFGLSPSRIQLEITENVLLEESAETARSLSTLRNAGVRIALDDFGRGYSSMNYLRRYNVDKIKIDRSFVAELGTSKEADLLVRTIVALARGLKLKVTAEGVENHFQREHLAAIGCDELQGYHLGRPMPADAFGMLLASIRSKGKGGAVSERVQGTTVVRTARHRS